MTNVEKKSERVQQALDYASTHKLQLGAALLIALGATAGAAAGIRWLVENRRKSDEFPTDQILENLLKEVETGETPEARLERIRLGANDIVEGVTSENGTNFALLHSHTHHFHATLDAQIQENKSKLTGFLRRPKKRSTAQASIRYYSWLKKEFSTFTNTHLHEASREEIKRGHAVSPIPVEEYGTYSLGVPEDGAEWYGIWERASNDSTVPQGFLQTIRSEWGNVGINTIYLHNQEKGINVLAAGIYGAIEQAMTAEDEQLLIHMSPKLVNYGQEGEFLDTDTLQGMVPWAAPGDYQSPDGEEWWSIYNTSLPIEVRETIDKTRIMVAR